MSDLSFVKQKISLHDIIKSIYSYTYNKFPGNDGLTAEFYIHFSNELAILSFQMFMTLGKTLAPWVLLLV